MEKTSLAIATITWARDEGEETLLLASISTLSQLGIPVFVTDGGSSERFLESVRHLPQVSLFRAKGLWLQAGKSIAEAQRSGAGVILYTEPDKLDFFKLHLPSLIENSHWHEQAGVVLASRSAKAFSSFPSFQQMTETTINRCCKEVTGRETDYCYGPFLFNAELVPYLDVLPETIGWGWRPFLFATAFLSGYTVAAQEGDFMCPPDQRIDDPEERVYRMKQLAQNIDGLVLATTKHNAGN
jgi:hypothetical protein